MQLLSGEIAPPCVLAGIVPGTTAERKRPTAELNIEPGEQAGEM